MAARRLHFALGFTRGDYIKDLLGEASADGSDASAEGRAHQYSHVMLHSSNWNFSGMQLAEEVDNEELTFQERLEAYKFLIAMAEDELHREEQNQGRRASSEEDSNAEEDALTKYVSRLLLAYSGEHEKSDQYNSLANMMVDRSGLSQLPPFTLRNAEKEMSISRGIITSLHYAHDAR